MSHHFDGKVCLITGAASGIGHWASDGAKDELARRVVDESTIQPPFRNIYFLATKWAVTGLTEAIAMELRPMQIRVNAVALGFIDTPTNAGVLAGPEEARKQEENVALGRMGIVDEVAEVVAFLFR